MRRSLVVLAVGLVAFWWLFRQRSMPATCTFTLDVAALRAAGNAIPGAKALRIDADQVASITFPEAAVVTGHGFSGSPMPMSAYQIVFPDQTVVVDTVLSDGQAKEMGAEVDDAAWARVKAGIEQASGIYVTHEHADHLGGLYALLGNPHVRAAAHVTREQLDHPERLDPLKVPAEAAQLTALSYEGLKAVAPGVVLVKAPGHTPGSQFVYVQLEGGTELLFLGDTAWRMDNIAEEVGPPHVVSLLLGNDRDANACQLKALHALASSSPKVWLVPGHDGPRMKALFAQGVLHDHFQPVVLPPPAEAPAPDAGP